MPPCSRAELLIVLLVWGQESEKKSSHSMSHPLLVPSPAECGTPESKLHHHQQRSLKQEKRCVSTVFSFCSSTDPTHPLPTKSLASRLHPEEPPPHTHTQLVELGSLTVLIHRLWLPWAQGVGVGGFSEPSLRRAPANTKHMASQMSQM